MKRFTRRTSPPPAHPAVASRAEEARHELSSRAPRGAVSESALAAACAELENALSDRDGSPLPEDRAHIITSAWIESIAETVDRLRSDREAIASWTGRPASDLAIVTGLDRSRSDPHRGGRRVAILEFRSGPRLVYKPRSVQPERVWARLVRWFDGRGCDPPLCAPRVLERPGYGWVEHVAGVRRPRARGRPEQAGLLLSLLDVFEVRDAHADNVAAGEGGPALVDPEAMSHPRFFAFEDAPSLALTGFVPAPTTTARPARGGPHARSRAGLGACLDPGEPFEEAIGSVVAGYEAGHRILERHADRVLAPGGPLEDLLGLRIRVLLRPTATYAEALASCGPPGGRRPVAGTERAAGQPPTAWARLAANDLPIPEAAAAPLLAAERAALARGDIPVFHALAGGTDLLIEAFADGAPRPAHPLSGGLASTIRGVFETSGAERIRGRLERLGAADRRENAELLAGILRFEALGREFGS